MKGTLFIAGGATTNYFPDIFKALVLGAGGFDSKLALIVTASGDGPDEMLRDYRADLEKIGGKPENLILVPIYDPSVLDESGFNAITGDHEKVLEALEGVTGVWFTGGDQYYTAGAFIRPDGTPTKGLERLHEIYNSGGAIGGSSAGAAIMSHVMIGDGTNRSVLMGEVLYDYSQYDEICAREPEIVPLIITRGLGFFPLGVVDQHFNLRPRLLRLIETCMLNREGQRVGYAVSEDTCLVYHPGGEITVIGAAPVYIADCRGAVRAGAGSYSGVILHAIQAGDSYNPATGEFAFAGDDSGKRRISVARDYYAGGVIDNPSFYRFIDLNLLRCKEESMATDGETGLPCARGADVYDVNGQDWAVVFRYTKGKNTRGYKNCVTSFTNVGLNTKAVKIEL